MTNNLKIISVNLGSPETIGGPGSAKFYPVKTGIRKVPVFSPLFVGPFGLEGDFIGNKKHHGGLDQAVYLYSVEDYSYWELAFEKPCPPGLFGENLTVEGLKSASALVGDRYRIGDVVLEVTSPRIPCSTFAAHMDDKRFPKKFLEAKRPGIYCRVLQTGLIAAGTAGTVEPFKGERVRLDELIETYPYKSINEETRQRYLAVPGHTKLNAFLKGETSGV